MVRRSACWAAGVMLSQVSTILTVSKPLPVNLIQNNDLVAAFGECYFSLCKVLDLVSHGGDTPAQCHTTRPWAFKLPLI